MKLLSLIFLVQMTYVTLARPEGPKLSLDEPEIILGEIEKNDTLHYIIDITNSGTEELKIDSIISTSSHWSTQFPKAIGVGKIGQIQLQYYVHDPIGFINSELRIYSNDIESEIIIIPVIGTIFQL